MAAYVYGLAPLSVTNTVPGFPRNQIVSIGQLVEPAIRTVVSPNVDTTYTVGQIDLSDGPLVVDVPDTKGRYYVLQFMDAYSNTFAYIGRRTTGTKPGSYVLVPPGYSGALPAGAKPIRSPTNLIWLIGRTLVKSAADVPAVTRLMGGYRLTPVARWSAGERAAPLVLASFPPKQNKLVLPTGLAYFDELGAALAANPPPKGDACALKAFRAVGHRPRADTVDAEDGSGAHGARGGRQGRSAAGHPRRRARERRQSRPQQRLAHPAQLHRRLRAQLARAVP